jgi:O-succinylbenzoic acid--CoA ligase
MTPEQLAQAWADGQIVPLVNAAEQRQLAATLGDGDPAAALQDLQRRHGPGVIIGSGGSLGTRRWCLQPLAHLQASAQATGAWLAQQGLDPQRCLHLNPLPWHHVSGLMPWLRARQWGARHQPVAPALMRDGAALAKAMPAAVLQAAGPAVLSLVPTQLQRLMAHPDGVAWLQQLALIWVGGAPMPAELAVQARQLGLRLAPCYGSTETAAMVCVQSPERFLAGEPGCGHPLADVVLRLDPASAALELQTPRLSPGWLEAGQWVPLPRTVDGWWRSGDAAQLSPVGLQILGRLDGAIHSGGETVFPEQVELQLRALIVAQGLPVAELLLLGEADPQWGERLVALLRLDGGVESDLAAWLQPLIAVARELPPAQRPRDWIVCPGLAPSTTGKWERQRWQAWLRLARSGSTAGQA